MPPSPAPRSLPPIRPARFADRTQVLELGSQATVADVMAAVEASQGEARAGRTACARAGTEPRLALYFSKQSQSGVDCQIRIVWCHGWTARPPGLLSSACPPARRAPQASPLSSSA